MVTVCIFLGSEETCGGGAAGGAAAGAGSVDGGAGHGESAAATRLAAVVAGAIPLMPGGIALWPLVTIGIVETTRGGGFGASMVTGCSSRDTRFSVEPVVATDCAALPAAPACGSSAILFGPLLALMIGGSVGNTDPPNMAR
jgi:hypothetical protein